MENTLPKLQTNDGVVFMAFTLSSVNGEAGAGGAEEE